MRNKILFLKRTAWTFCTAAFSIAIHGQNTAQIMEVPFTQVRIQDAFWSPRIETNRTVSIPSAFRECEKNGRFDNFAIAGGLKEGEHRGDFSFDDTDPYKIIEGASYSLAVKYDARLDAYLDSVIALIAAAQESDGYLTTCVTNRCTRLSGWWGTHRWEKINSHELYNSGHLYEAAVAHYRATGKRSLLDVAIKNADLVCRVFGPDEGQKHVPSGHPIVEMALAKLYKVTGKEEYLRTARYFVEETGRCTDGHAPSAYSQDHKPILEQNEIVGHAVRAGYLYSGVADVAGVVGSRMKYALVAAAAATVCFALFGGSGSAINAAEAEAILAQYSNPKGLIMLIPVAILLIVAFIKRNIYVACTWGLISGTIIGLVSGILVPSDIMGMQDGTLGGFLIDGVNNMIGTVGYLYAIAGIIGILSASGLLQQVIDGLVHSKLNRSVVGTEVIISVGLMVSSICLGSANGPAIIMWGPIANDLGKSKGLHPYRRANLMDGFGSTLPAVIPVTSAFIFIALSCIQGLMDTYSFVQEVSPVSLAGASLHCWFLFVVLAVAVITGWGRKYEGPNGEPVKALPAQTK